MNSSIIPVAEEVHDILSPLGFKKRSLVWSRRVQSILHIIFIWKKTFGDVYSVDFGVHLTGQSGRIPRMSDIDLQWSTHVAIERYEDRVEYLNALNMELQMPIEDRIAVIGGAIRSVILPRLEACSSHVGTARVLSGVQSGLMPLMCCIDREKFCAEFLQ